MGGGKSLLAIAVLVVAVLGVALATAFFAARDDSTIPGPASQGPGAPRMARDAPRIAAGNVVLLYSDERLTRALRELAEQTGGGPDPALAAAGQAVIVRREPDQPVPVVALSATHRLNAGGPDDPALRPFIEYWLGRTP